MAQVIGKSLYSQKQYIYRKGFYENPHELHSQFCVNEHNQEKLCTVSTCNQRDLKTTLKGTSGQQLPTHLTVQY